MDLILGPELLELITVEAALEGQQTAILQDQAVQQAFQDPEVQHAVEAGNQRDLKRTLTDSLMEFHSEEEAEARAEQTMNALHNVDPSAVEQTRR